MLNELDKKMKKLDLTSKEGLIAMGKFLVDNKLSLFTNPLGPYEAIIKLIIKAVFGDGPESIQREQRQTIEAAIQKGKDSGVDEMEIQTNDTTGIKLNVPIDGVKIDTILGKEGKVLIKVKYK